MSSRTVISETLWLPWEKLPRAPLRQIFNQQIAVSTRRKNRRRTDSGADDVNTYRRVHDENWWRTDSQKMWDCFIYLWRTPAKIAGEPIHRCCTFVSMMKIGGNNPFTKWKLVVVEAIPGNEQMTVSIGGELLLVSEIPKRRRKREKEKPSLSTRCQRAMSACSLFREENFQEKPLRPE